MEQRDGAAAELADCFAQRTSVMVAGRLVEIHALGLERMQQYTEFIEPAFESGLKFIFSIASQPDAANAIILASMERPDEPFVLGLSPPERVRLALAIQKVNEDAFRWALLAQNQVTESLIRMSGAGSTPSNSSRSTDTPMPGDSRPAPPPGSSAPSPAPNGVASAIAP